MNNEYAKENFKVRKDVLAYSRVNRLLNETAKIQDVFLINMEDNEEFETIVAEIITIFTIEGKLEDFIDSAFIRINGTGRLDYEMFNMEVLTQLACDFFTSTGSRIIKSMQIKLRELNQTKSLDMNLLEKVMEATMKMESKEAME